MAKNKGVLAYFADSGQRKIADFRDFGPFWASKKATKIAKIRAFWLILRIPGQRKIADFRDFGPVWVFQNPPKWPK